MKLFGATTNMTGKTNYWRTTDDEIANKIQILMFESFWGNSGPDMFAPVFLIPEPKLYNVWVTVVRTEFGYGPIWLLRWSDCTFSQTSRPEASPTQGNGLNCSVCLCSCVHLDNFVISVDGKCGSPHSEIMMIIMILLLLHNEVGGVNGLAPCYTLTIAVGCGHLSTDQHCPLKFFFTGDEQPTRNTSTIQFGLNHLRAG